nr:GIY-YIG nuclease family protein [Veillonella sp.]
MVRCADDTLYTGWTTDLRRRMRAHNGKIKGGAKYTKSRRPVKLVWFDAFDIKQEAQSREYAVKQLSREKKLALSANLDDGDKIDEANSL